MLLRFKSSDRLKEELAQVNQQIEKHQLENAPIAEASALIENLKKEGLETKAIRQQLAERSLPSVEEVGKATATHLLNLNRLKSRKAKLKKKLACFQNFTPTMAALSLSRAGAAHLR